MHSSINQTNGGERQREQRMHCFLFGCDTRPRTHVALATNGAFLAATLTTVASVLDHTASHHRLHIHIFSECRFFLRLQHQAMRFWCNLATHGAKLTLHELDASAFDLARRGCPQRCLQDVFAEQLRIYLPVLLPSVETVLWLDSDGLVLGDVVALMQRTFVGRYKNRSIAAVLRPKKTLEGMLQVDNAVGRRKLARLKLHGLSGPSFNGGLMALNLRRWRTTRLSERIAELLPRLRYEKLHRFGGMSTTSDAQTPIAMLCLNATPMDVEPLPETWNVAGLGWKPMTKAQLAKGNFLHWSGKHKPWKVSHDHHDWHTDLWRMYEQRVKGAQDSPQDSSPRQCTGLDTRRDAQACTEQRMAALDALAKESHRGVAFAVTTNRKLVHVDASLRRILGRLATLERTVENSSSQG